MTPGQSPRPYPCHRAGSSQNGCCRSLGEVASSSWCLLEQPHWEMFPQSSRKRKVRGYCINHLGAAAPGKERTDVQPHLTRKGHHSAKDVGLWQQSCPLVWHWLSIMGKPSPLAGANSPYKSSALCTRLCNAAGVWAAGGR